MSCSTIVNLPENILIYIRILLCRRPWNYEDMDEFELHLTEDRKEELQENFYWINFMNTTKLFQGLKKKSIYLSLNQKVSMRYFKDDKFYHYINEKLIANPLSQLNINLQTLKSLKKKFLEKKGGGIHCLKLCDDLGKISLSQLTEGVKILRITDCSEFPAEISCVEHVETLQISRCQSFRTFSLGNTFQKLYLHGCHSVTDISSLESCPNLKILYVGWCLNLRAGYQVFSKLQEVLLFKQELKRLEDYSFLSTVEKISIESDSKITSHEISSYFGNVKDLSLIRCSEMTSFGQVPKLTTVYLDECENLNHISFETLPSLTTMYLVDNLALQYLFIPDGGVSKLMKLALNGCKSMIKIESNTPTLQRLALLDLTKDDPRSRHTILCSIKKAHPTIKIVNAMVILC